MKYSFVAAALAAITQTASAHYIWETINGGPAYQYYRQNSNYNSPVTDVTSTDMRCNVGASSGNETFIDTLTVPAGSVLTLGLDIAVYHDGPVLFYLGQVPAGLTADDWDGSGTQWFKFYEEGPTFSGSGEWTTTSTWPLFQTYQITIPPSLPPGQWLLRSEQIGLQNPEPALPQFYIGCAQLEVTGGGTCEPDYFVIPGHIQSDDPGITVDIYYAFTTYTMPGPAVYPCTANDEGAPPPPTTTPSAPTTTPVTTTTPVVVVPTTTSSKPTTTPTTTAKTTTPTTTPAKTTTPTTTPSKTTTPTTTPSKTTTGSTGGQTLYGQCGGIGWTGPTSCSQGTCNVLNPYYSQCT